MKSAARRSKSAASGLPCKISAANGSSFRSRASVASDCFLGLYGRYKSSSRLMLSADSMAAASSGVSFALAVDRSQNGLLPLGQHPQPADAILNFANLLFIQPAGLIFAIPRDERNGIAGVQQPHSSFHLCQGQRQAVGNRRKINSRCEAHAIEPSELQSPQRRPRVHRRSDLANARGVA